MSITKARKEKAVQRTWPINPNLVWDYDIPDNPIQNEAFKRWYLARVLTRGSADDIRTIGLDTIYTYLSALNLPSEIRSFWNWYFGLPAVKEHYEHLNTLAAEDS
jgi:hypothetical protein